MTFKVGFQGIRGLTREESPLGDSGNALEGVEVYERRRCPSSNKKGREAQGEGKKGRRLKRMKKRTDRSLEY